MLLDRNPIPIFLVEFLFQLKNRRVRKAASAQSTSASSGQAEVVIPIPSSSSSFPVSDVDLAPTGAEMAKRAYKLRILLCEVSIFLEIISWNLARIELCFFEILM